jgi:NADH:ubiquinone oxidoreductase subunit
MAFNITEWGLTAYLRLVTWRDGAPVGTDGTGNAYYRSRRVRAGRREKRWVVYAGDAEATRVPPEWHGWLHHTFAEPPSADSPHRRPWQKPPEVNATGTSHAYLPPGHPLRGGHRPHATGDYEPWTPG